MGTATRILGFICMWAACDRTFPVPEVSVHRPEGGPPRIETGTGRVSGYYMNSISGGVIGAYEGIPYAESPEGHLRFRDPVPKRRWNGTLRADRRPSCIQMDPSRYYRVIGQEDCLVINVYVPLFRKTGRLNLPVLLWVHGGSWHWGAGSNYGPSYLLDYDVILVTFNYRLGPMGFLSSGDSEISGNFGLKDQAMAIKWVKNNIQHFGGDPNQITLIGHSAGGAAVHLHMMSPLSAGNFQRSISLSGTALAFWGTPPNQTSLSRRLAKSLGCSSTGKWRSIANCLRQKPAHRIVSKQYDLFEVLEIPSILFGPVVEPESSSAFLAESPHKFYEKGKVAKIPWMTGIVRDEGDLFTLVNYAAPLAIRMLLKNLDANIPLILSYDPIFKKTTSEIKKFYFGESPKFSFSGFEYLSALSTMLGDRYFYFPFHKTLEIHSKTVDAPLYAYYFTHDGTHSLSEKLHLPASEWGVMHQDDTQYLFNCTEFYYPLKQTDRDFIISRQFTDLIVNFAASGGQARRWEPYTLRHPKLLEINFNSEMIEEPYPDRINFWKSINI